MPVMGKYIVEVATPKNLGTEDAELNRLDQLKPKKFPQILKTTRRLVLLAMAEYLKLKESLPNVDGSTSIVSNVLTATSFWMPLTFLMVSKGAFFATLVIGLNLLKLVRRILNMPKPLSTLLSSVVTVWKMLVPDVMALCTMRKKWQ